MNRIRLNRNLVALAFAALLAPASVAQSSTPDAQPTPSICPPSTTLDELIKALDDAVSGPVEKDRACMRALMMPDARLIPVVKAPDGSYVPHPLTVDGWIEAVRKHTGNIFYERQVKYATEQYGHFAHLWSTYEVRPTPDGKATVRGINSIQTVNDGKGWKVIEIVWEAESPGEPVPEKYLP
jgi:hypothetical protein